MLFPKKYDVFISYAIEDKSAIAEKLAKGLRDKGIDAYYAGYELQVGDEIADQIYSGLEKSRYGIVILSPDYIRKWPEVERSQFLQRERRENDSLIFPVWHMITYEQVKSMYPELSDRYGLSTTQGVDNITENIYAAILKRKKKRMMKWLRLFSIIAVFFFLLGVTLNTWYRRHSFATALPSNKVVEFNVLKRMSDFQKQTDNELHKELAQENSQRVYPDILTETYERFAKVNAHFRNSFSFWNGYDTYDSREKILAAGIQVNDGPYDYFHIASPAIWQLTDVFETGHDPSVNCSFILQNQAQVGYHIDTIFFSGSRAHARVTYSNYMRTVRCKYNYNSLRENFRKQEVKMTGFKPTEEYVFQVNRTKSDWTLIDVK